MVWFKRIFLFMLTNVLVLVTLSIVLSLLGVGPYMDRYGINYESLAVFSLVWGFGGALISLALSRVMAKWMMGVKLVDSTTADGNARWLLDTVHRLARMGGLQTMPEVGIYESADLNAFATGPTSNRALVAVSSGLLQRMSREEVEGVLGHEITHITNGDMITMTLLQGVINAFVIFFSRIAAFAVTNMLRGERDSRRGNDYMMQFIFRMLFEIVFSMLGMVVVAWFSRKREYRADAGGARLAGKAGMISALNALKRNYELPPAQNEPAMVAALKIGSNRRGGLFALFATHPPLDDRIAALQGTSGV